MQNLYCPWRTAYAQSHSEEKKSNIGPRKCAFCHQLALQQDAQHFILRRFKHNFAMLNLYPYNAGHILILPNKHKKQLSQLSLAARTELMEITSAASDLMHTQLGALGVNIGLNLGRSAGAGMPSHLHMHVLPRWAGDTNFLPLLANTKVISFDLKAVYHDLKPHFDALKI